LVILTLKAFTYLLNPCDSFKGENVIKQTHIQVWLENSLLKGQSPESERVMVQGQLWRRTAQLSPYSTIKKRLKNAYLKICHFFQHVAKWAANNCMSWNFSSL
jgi:hypothetical protein